MFLRDCLWLQGAGNDHRSRAGTGHQDHREYNNLRSNPHHNLISRDFSDRLLVIKDAFHERGVPADLTGPAWLRDQIIKNKCIQVLFEGEVTVTVVRTHAISTTASFPAEFLRRLSVFLGGDRGRSQSAAGRAWAAGGDPGGGSADGRRYTAGYQPLRRALEMREEGGTKFVPVFVAGGGWVMSMWVVGWEYNLSSHKI